MWATNPSHFYSLGLSEIDLISRRRKSVLCSTMLALLVLMLFEPGQSEAADPDFQNITIGVMISQTGPKKLGKEAIAAINLSIEVSSVCSVSVETSKTIVQHTLHKLKKMTASKS